VHKRCSIVLVEQALLSTLEGTRDQLISGRVHSASPPGPPAMFLPGARIRHPLSKEERRGGTGGKVDGWIDETFY